jgi:hypothetical protein
MSRFLLVVAALAALTLTNGCRLHDGCPPLASRCNGNVAELCDPDGDWIVIADCDAISPQPGARWACVAPTSSAAIDAGLDGATCLPVDARPRVAAVSR